MNFVIFFVLRLSSPVMKHELSKVVIKTKAKIFPKRKQAQDMKNELQ
jgi:hypothetical protein